MMYAHLQAEVYVIPVQGLPSRAFDAKRLSYLYCIYLQVQVVPLVRSPLHRACLIPPLPRPQPHT